MTSADPDRAVSGPTQAPARDLAAERLAISSHPAEQGRPVWRQIVQAVMRWDFAAFNGWPPPGGGAVIAVLRKGGRGRFVILSLLPDSSSGLVETRWQVSRRAGHGLPAPSRNKVFQWSLQGGCPLTVAGAVTKRRHKGPSPRFLFIRRQLAPARTITCVGGRQQVPRQRHLGQAVVRRSRYMSMTQP